MPAGFRFTIAVSVIAAAMPPLILTAQRRGWRISLKQLLLVMAVLAVASWWAREDLRLLVPVILHPRIILNVLPLAPFATSWILTAAILGPRKPLLPRKPSPLVRRRRWRRKRIFPWAPLLPVVAYIVIDNVWLLATVTFYRNPVSLWSEPIEFGAPL
jgi:hypothetical protein